MTQKELKINYIKEISKITANSLCSELGISYSNFQKGNVSEQKLDELIAIINHKVSLLQQDLYIEDF